LIGEIMQVSLAPTRIVNRLDPKNRAHKRMREQQRRKGLC
jgi:hypothetical protein